MIYFSPFDKFPPDLATLNLRSISSFPVGLSYLLNCVNLNYFSWETIKVILLEFSIFSVSGVYLIAALIINPVSFIFYSRISGRNASSGSILLLNVSSYKNPNYGIIAIWLLNYLRFI